MAFPTGRGPAQPGDRGQLEVMHGAPSLALGSAWSRGRSSPCTWVPRPRVRVGDACPPGGTQASCSPGSCPLSGPEEPDAGEAQHRQLPARHHGSHQAAGPQVPAGLQRAERHCESAPAATQGAGAGLPGTPPAGRAQAPPPASGREASLVQGNLLEGRELPRAACCGRARAGGPVLPLSGRPCCPHLPSLRVCGGGQGSAPRTCLTSWLL